MARSIKKIKKDIEYQETLISDAKKIKAVLNNMKKFIDNAKKDLEQSEKYFKGDDPLGTDWGYTHDNGRSSIDKGRINNLILNIEALKTRMFDIINKTQTEVIPNYEKKLKNYKNELEEAKAEQKNS